MQVIDAQIHLWSKGTTLPPHRAEPYTMAQALADMDAAGVDGAIIHPPSWDVDSNELAVAAAKAHPNRFAILGRLQLDKPESRGLVADWKKRPGMLGFRFTFLQPHMKSWPHDGTLDWIFPLAERAGTPIALLASEFLPKLSEVATKHPGLRLIVDHIAAIRGHPEGPFVKLPELVALAKHPNIAVKITGGPGVATDPYPFKSLHPVYRRLYDAFGPSRLFWGTDITRMPCSWKQCVTAFTEEMPWLPAKDLELIMGKAVCDWLGWKRQ